MPSKTIQIKVKQTDREVIEKNIAKAIVDIISNQIQLETIDKRIRVYDKILEVLSNK